MGASYTSDALSVKVVLCLVGGKALYRLVNFVFRDDHVVFNDVVSECYRVDYADPALFDILGRVCGTGYV